MPPKKHPHLLLFLQSQQRETMSKGVEDDLWILVDGRVDNTSVEEKVLLGQKVQRRNREATVVEVL